LLGVLWLNLEMNFQELSKTNAFIEGSELWIIPKDDSNFWQHQLDWYLNFRLNNTFHHEKNHLSESILEIAENEEMNIKEIECSPECPKLLVGEHYFPCKYFLQIDFTEENSWFESIELNRSMLQVQKARVFLPQGIQRERFFDLAKSKLSQMSELSFVLA